MKLRSICLLLEGVVLSSASLVAQVQAGVTFSGDGLRNFYLAIGSYYHVPEQEVVVVRERQLPPDEIPVVFYVAQRAHIQPAVIIDLRRKGLSWADVAVRCHVDPEIYAFRDGPPYGKAYGYWKNHPPRDAEVIEAVNVHFLSDYHRVPPDVIVAERSRRGSYAGVIVTSDAETAKHADRGKGHGKGHDR
jgi:hypothetical protein